jgi:hypothetical protein
MQRMLYKLLFACNCQSTYTCHACVRHAPEMLNSVTAWSVFLSGSLALA